MSAGRESMRWEADFTDWRVGLENVREKLQQIRQQLRDTAKDHDQWTGRQRKNFTDLARQERELLELRRRLNMQMRGGAAFGDTSAFANGMANARMQTLALAFAIDDMMTVMAQQGTGIQGFTAGLAAAANNISMMLIAINPWLAILPSLGVLILRGFVKPMIDAGEATKDATKALEDQRQKLRGIIDERRSLEIGEAATKEMRRRDDFQEEFRKQADLVKSLREQKEFASKPNFGFFLEDVWKNKLGLGSLGVLGESWDQIFKGRAKDVQSLDAQRRAALGNLQELVGNEQLRREMALKRFQGEGEGSPQAMRIKQLEKQKRDMELAITEAENAERRTTPKWRIRQMKKEAERIGAEAEGLQIQLDDTKMVRELRENNMSLKTLIDIANEFRDRGTLDQLRLTVPPVGK